MLKTDAIRKYADIKYSNGEQIEFVNGILKSISIIREQPTADVVEVVRCKDCKRGDVIILSKKKYGEETIVCYCNLGNRLTDVESYCSGGERRDT